MRSIQGSNDQNRRELFEWMAARVPSGWPLMPDDFRAIYISDGDERLGVVAFTNWTVSSVELHIATDRTKRWATKDFLSEVYRYVFEVGGRTRFNALVAEDNTEAVQLHRRLGHTYEGRLKHEYGVGKHALIFGMTFEDWQHSKWNRNKASGINIPQPKQGSINVETEGATAA